MFSKLLIKIISLAILPVFGDLIFHKNISKELETILRTRVKRCEEKSLSLAFSRGEIHVCITGFTMKTWRRIPTLLLTTIQCRLSLQQIAFQFYESQPEEALFQPRISEDIKSPA